MARDKAQGVIPRGPGFAETVVSPFLKSVTAKGRYNLEQESANKRAIAQALVQMGQIGVPGQHPGAPTIDLPGVGGLPMISKPETGTEAYNRMRAKNYGQLNPLEVLKFTGKVHDPWLRQMAGLKGDPGVDPFNEFLSNLAMLHAIRQRDKQTYSEQDITDSMNDYPDMTREDVIAEYKKRGFTLEGK